MPDVKIPTPRGTTPLNSDEGDKLKSYGSLTSQGLGSGRFEDNMQQVQPIAKNGKNFFSMGKVTFIDNAQGGNSRRRNVQTKDMTQTNFSKKDVIRSQRLREISLMRSLERWQKVIMMPDPQIETHEPVRPFVIM